MRARCPTVQFLCRARLRDYQLVFPRKSIRWDCGVAGIVPGPGHEVWGVVYDVADGDVPLLDKTEGYYPKRPLSKSAYTRKEVTVTREGDSAARLPVQTYFAVPQPNPPLPSRAYLQLIVEGARFWNLPPEYIHSLEEQEVLQ
jgi:gamma-glutamylcyclotransferase